MKRDLTALVKAVEKKFGQSVTMATDFEKLAFAFARQHVTLHPPKTIVDAAFWSGETFGRNTG